MRTISKEDLKVILENHKHWLNMNCEEWEEMHVNLRGADLNGADLEKENVDLKGKNKALEQYADLADEKVDKLKGQLTEASEIILELLNSFAYPIGREDWTVEDTKIVDKAEQFLKDSGVEK